MMTKENHKSSIKVCRYCEKELQRRNGEHASHFAKRRYCDRACAGAARAIKSPSSSRMCNHCGEALNQRDREPSNNFRRRKYCNSRCANAARFGAANIAPKCAYCGKTVLITNSDSSPSHVARKRFCDRKCMGAAWRVSAANETVLDELTPEACYWIGFLFADGSVHQPKRGQGVISLVLAVQDIEHVEKFRAFFGANAKLSYRASYTISNGYTAQAQVKATVTSQHLVDTLARYGFRKNPRWATVPELANSRDFWRGAIDGDGSIGLVKRFNLPTIYLCGYRELLTQYASFLKSHCPHCPATLHSEGTIFRVKTTTAADALTMLDVLYTDCTIALERKHKLAMELLRTRPNRAGRIRYPKHIRIEIAHRYAAGEQLRQLAEAYEMNYSAVYKIVKALGVPLRRTCKRKLSV